MILLRYLCGRFLRPLPFVCVTLIVYGVKNKLLWKFIADFFNDTDSQTAGGQLSLTVFPSPDHFQFLLPGFFIRLFSPDSKTFSLIKADRPFIGLIHMEIIYHKCRNIFQYYSVASRF